jgi:glycosidase
MMSKLAEIDWAKIKSKRKTPSPTHWEDQVLYFLLVDRFSNAKEKDKSDIGITPLYKPADQNNAVQTAADAKTWRDAGTSWTGGNLKGLKSKLSYLKGLGISTIWLSPVLKQVAFEDSYHGYGIQDFLTVDPHFGSNEELKELVEEAHQQNIYVILDIIINHSGNVFSYDPALYGENIPGWNGGTYKVKGFNDKSGKPTIAFSATNTADPDAALWPKELQSPATFTQKGKINNWDNYPEYLDGDFESLKDIHLGTGGLESYQPSEALVNLCTAYKYWMAFADLDGFRIDTVKHMDPGAARYFVSVFHEFAQTIGKDNFYLIGEVTGGRHNAVETIDNTGLDAALGIDEIQNALENTVKGYRAPAEYFNLFRNSLLDGKDSHTWYNDKIVTMIDDHDKVCKGDNKTRFCANGGSSLIFNAMALNVTTIGIPCIYYGTEQAFDGHGAGNGSDRYIRETMFGGEFGAFRSRDRHFFDTNNPVYKDFSRLLSIRHQHLTLKRGRQYLREISGDGISFGYPQSMANTAIRSIIAWSRIMDTQEYLVAFSNDLQNDLAVWVTIDGQLNQVGDRYKCIYSSAGALADIKVEARNDKAVRVSIPKGGFVIYSK